MEWTRSQEWDILQAHQSSLMPPYTVFKEKATPSVLCLNNHKQSEVNLILEKTREVWWKKHPWSLIITPHRQKSKLRWILACSVLTFVLDVWECIDNCFKSVPSPIPFTILFLLFYFGVVFICLFVLFCFAEPMCFPKLLLVSLKSGNVYFT